jgi:hypothetical protein
MRITVPSGVGLAAATLGIAFCQPPSPNGGPVSNEGVPKHQAHQVFTGRQVVTEEIRHLISSPTPLTELNAPLLRRMGDGAAAEVTAIMKARGPLSEPEQQNVVQILHKAFEHPATIMIKSNQTTPTATLALLDQLSAGTEDVQFMQLIAGTKQFVVEASAWHR